MASALIQSNAQSALIATLNSAQGASVNPFEYTLSKRIPSHGVQHTKLFPVNAEAAVSGGSISFDLTKMGITRSLCFECRVKYDTPTETTDVHQFSRIGFLQFIDRIDLESSSRRVLTMSRAAIQCAISDLDQETRNAIAGGLSAFSHFRKERVAIGSTGSHVCYLPLLFSCFDNGNLALSTGFTEPMRVTIHFSSDFNIRDVDGTSKLAANVNGKVPVTLLEPRLIVEHRLLPNEMEDATIAANYSQGPLSQLVYDYEEETPIDVTHEDTKGYGGLQQATVKVELKSTAVVTDIYVIVEKNRTTANFTVGTTHGGQKYKNEFAPMEVESIKFTASGQTICDSVPGTWLQTNSRRTLKDGFYASCPGATWDAADDNGRSDAMRSGWVYRLQFGLDASKQYDSGAISLRELNAPTLEVTLPKFSASAHKPSGMPKWVMAGDDDNTVNGETGGYKVRVVLRKLGLQTTDSSSGRVVSTLSN